MHERNEGSSGVEGCLGEEVVRTWLAGCLSGTQNIYTQYMGTWLPYCTIDTTPEPSADLYVILFAKQDADRERLLADYDEFNPLSRGL